jgi:type IV secretory pathway protease TraF
MLVKRLAQIEKRGDTLFYYMLGDNADNSNDSRSFGWVEERLIIGMFWKK